MTTKTTPARISPSGLGAYYTCPRKYYYQKRWRAKKIDKALQDGIDTHLLMQGKKLAQPNARATQMYWKLMKLRKAGGYVSIPRWKEKQREVLSPDGKIVIQQTLDDVAVVADYSVVIDYKTSNWPWWTSETGRITPKAEGGFQSVAYLLPPNKMPKSFPFTYRAALYAVCASSHRFCCSGVPRLNSGIAA